MPKYIFRRTLVAIPSLIAISIFSFIIIQLPPGDYLTSYVMGLRQTGDTVDEQELAALTERYGLGKPIYVQYWRWITGILRGYHDSRTPDAHLWKPPMPENHGII